MSKIRILAIPPDNYGVGKYRILDPYKYLSEHYSDEFHVDITFNAQDNDEQFENYDIVVFHTFIHQLSHEKNVERIKKLKSKGVKVIMDIDDLWFVDQRHPMFHQIRDSQMAIKKYDLMKLVDYVSTTTKIFAATIKERTGLTKVLIFPNAVDSDELQFQSNPTKSNKIRFGWLGGSTHLHDLELMRSGISTILSEFKDEVQFVLCGFDVRGVATEINPITKEKKNRPMTPSESIWNEYEKILTDNYKYLDKDYKEYLMKYTEEEYPGMYDTSYVRVWTQPITRYAFSYNNFDISLAPLTQTQFNANKSQLKIIEAGFHKKPIIASETEPYTLDLISAYDKGNFNNKGNSLLVLPSKNHKQWAQHMKRLIENPILVEDLRNKLNETVRDTYSLKTVTEQRIQFFKTII